MGNNGHENKKKSRIKKYELKKNWKRRTKRTEETNKVKQREDYKTMQTGHT